jgi:hypothetical protein
VETFTLIKENDKIMIEDKIVEIDDLRYKYEQKTQNFL